MTNTAESLTTVEDCTLNGKPISLACWPKLSSDELAAIVGKQEPGGVLEDARDYTWRFAVIPLADLEHCNEDGEAPEGGWAAAHKRHLQADAEAVSSGSPEYAGRDEWLRDVWGKNTAIHPIYAVKENDGYRLWDGYRRLAGAFFHGGKTVAVLVGAPR